MSRKFWALAAALLCLPVQALAGERQDAKVLMSTDPEENKQQEYVGYSDAIVTGDTVYMSGLVAMIEPGETDLKPAYRRAFVRIGKILERAGVSWDDVVEITSFHTEMLTQMPAMLEVKKEFMRQPHPAWTAVGVTRLGGKNSITEIRIIAKRSKTAATA